MKVPQSRFAYDEVGHRQLLFFRGSSFQADCFAASRSPMRTDPKELQILLLAHNAEEFEGSDIRDSPILQQWLTCES